MAGDQNWYSKVLGLHCDGTNDAWVAFRNLETKGVLMSRNINTTTDMIVKEAN